MPGVLLCKKEDCASFDYCDDFNLKTELFKLKDITHNGPRLCDGPEIKPPNYPATHHVQT
jgi:hypothetical protein